MNESRAQFTLRVAGQQYRCSCGCNVFHKPDATERPTVYACNVCEAWHEGEHRSTRASLPVSGETRDA